MSAESRRRSTLAIDSLAKRCPSLAKEWHPSKNGDLTPATYLAGSGRRVWWKCSVGDDHEWTARGADRIKGKGSCPFCSKNRASTITSLAAVFPKIAAEWHPTKNGDLSPDSLLPGSSRLVWWKCPRGPDHEWQQRVGHRTKGIGCPYCSGVKVSKDNSLAARFPEIAAQWHPAKNGILTPDSIAGKSGKNVWWQCPRFSDHVWRTPVANRTVNGNGCPACSGRMVTAANSLAALHPSLARQWHPTRNGVLTPDACAAKSHRKVWWQCEVAEDHVWEAPVDNRANGRGCPYCRGIKASVTNSLLHRYPEIAAQWHPLKNGKLRPESVVSGSQATVWWRCSRSNAHVWRAAVVNRTSGGQGCPMCTEQEFAERGSIAARYPELAKQWHPTRNGKRTPAGVAWGSGKKVWWKCPRGEDHEWQATPNSRTNRSDLGNGCPFCRGLRISKTNSLAIAYPAIAGEWHPTRNGSLQARDCTWGSGRRVWWQCARAGHEWQDSVVHRTRAGRGCPACSGWGVVAIRNFVRALLPYVETLTPAELYVLAQQAGALNTAGKGKGFVKALTTGRFPLEELEKFEQGQPSLVERFIEDENAKLQAFDETEPYGEQAEHADDVVDATVPPEGSDALPTVRATDALAALDAPFLASADAEAVEFLTASALAKIWRHAFRDERGAFGQVEAFHGDEYAERAKRTFLREYRKARRLKIPKGYSFGVEGQRVEPFLMQRLVAYRVAERRRVGNWSGTGAGKTLSAILASRVIDSGLTLIFCPNSVVNHWVENIVAVFPAVQVAQKTWSPEWHGRAPKYLVLNYEALQQSNSSRLIREFLKRHAVRCVVIDEIHYAKQRHATEMSRRKQNLLALLSACGDADPELAVLAMSATPVINNLQEGKTLIEMLRGTELEELETTPTVSNCMRLYQQLVTHGIRAVPEYDTQCHELVIEVDCSDYLDEVRALGSTGTPLALEQVLTEARLPTILQHIEPQTLVYTHLIDKIGVQLGDAVERAGWRVGFFTGEDKDGLGKFLRREIDVLIGTSAISTGVDGLQHVCKKIIFNVLPWTHAEYQQIKGRLYRHGQKQDVTLVIPSTFATINGERWSWCDGKRQRLEFKRSIADAAVDGWVPEGQLRSPAQALQDALAWLRRLDGGQMANVQRNPIRLSLPDEGDDDVKQRRGRFGHFSQMNRRWNMADSTTTQARLRTNPDEWSDYHAFYREARKAWTKIPYEELARWAMRTEGFAIGDFGCGEALFAAAVEGRHTVHSFDHVAISEKVIAGDMSHVPLDNETLDVAVFSLSLMGSNFCDYLKEAHRVLKPYGHLHIVEATSRFSNVASFVAALETMGFERFKVTTISDRFTWLHGSKGDRPFVAAEIRF